MEEPEKLAVVNAPELEAEVVVQVSEAAVESAENLTISEEPKRDEIGVATPAIEDTGDQVADFKSTHSSKKRGFHEMTKGDDVEAIESKPGSLKRLRLADGSTVELPTPVEETCAVVVPSADDLIDAL